jgi:formylmethanofuran dehydrogenase subunit A
MGSAAEEMAKYVNNHNHLTLDMGQVIFTNTTTMTADGPFQYTLYELSGHKWMNHDVETETSAGIVPFHYRRKNYVNATQWSIGLELALLINDPWKMFMTTDHPNGGPFTAYPKIIAWLISKKARMATLKRTHPKTIKRSLLPSIKRELSLYEIAVVTRAGQAKALGLKEKGHLGVGADADVAIYNVNPEKIDLSRKYKTVRRAFTNAAYTIKDGKVVVKDGEIVQHVDGRTMWLDVKTAEQVKVDAEVKRKFKEYWTVEYENYPVAEHYLKVSSPITVKASV